MSDLVRDSALGYVVRLVTGSKVLRYDEEHPEFQLPESYQHPPLLKSRPMTSPDMNISEFPSESSSVSMEHELDPRSHSNDVESDATTRTEDYLDTEKAETKADTERAIVNSNLAKEPSRPIVPTVSSDGTILVDWYATDDPANPQNWSSVKKGFVAFQICLYTFSVYIGSAIYSPSVDAVTQVFGVSITAASLGLALYVFGYGTGPLIFAPLSEMPIIGRNPPYILTFGIFVMLCIPTALVNNFAGLLVLRFLQGFFGSPCLATGGASYGDMYNNLQLPFLMLFWTASATGGPALGPTIAGFSVAAENWRWPFWEMLWIAGPIFILLFICLPETSANNILLRRAARLRKLTGNDNFRSQSELDQRRLKTSTIVIEALWRPAQITILDPAITFATIYTSLVYAIYYSFFEAFPLVYVDIYGFNLGEQGLAFLAIIVSLMVGAPIYALYIYLHVNPSIRTRGHPSHEARLAPALIACILAPIGLFIFAWGSKASIHWIVSMIGITIYTLGIFIVFQCIFIYIPLSYPQYTASLLAGNDFCRSALSAGAILFARPLFLNLGIGPGVSLLGGLTVGCVAGTFALWYWGASLRARSRFAVK